MHKNRAEAREIMRKLGYGPDKRLQLKVSTRNIPPYRDPAVLLTDPRAGHPRRSPPGRDRSVHPVQHVTRSRAGSIDLGVSSPRTSSARWPTPPCTRAISGCSVSHTLISYPRDACRIGVISANLQIFLSSSSRLFWNNRQDDDRTISSGMGRQFSYHRLFTATD